MNSEKMWKAKQQAFVKDIEMQQPHAPVQNGIRATHHLTALQCLFGLSEQELHRWPGMTAYCQYLEKSFQPLLTDDYSYLWGVIGQERPHEIEQCWSWFSLVASMIHSIKDEDSSIEDIWKNLKAPSPMIKLPRPSELEEASCLIAVFSALCWCTMTFQPKLDWCQIGSFPRLMVHQHKLDQHALKMDTVCRPIPSIFRKLRRTMVTSQWRKPIGSRGCKTQDSAPLYVSSLNYASLKMIGKVQLVWVDNLTSHLDFDPKSRRLSIFKFPSYCAICTLKGGEVTPVFVGLLRALYNTDEDSEENNLQLYQEVLMSYRLLFGQSRSSRKFARVSLKVLENKNPREYDQLLDLLCCQSFNSKTRALPLSLWPISCCSFEDELQEECVYNSQDDFPMFGQRLTKLQEFNLRQQPSKLRDLWRDRRDPLQWYTLWAILISGSLSFLVSLLQLIVGVAQLVTSLL